MSNDQSIVQLSIITPVFNGERFIEFCMKNVIEQDCPSAEHIIIDGGSRDATISIIERYAKRYSHIRWVSEKDRGQSDAMNKGIALSRGRIIGTLNVDDYYEPGVLIRILKIFETLPEPSFLAGNCNVWDDEGKLLFVSRPAEISLTNILVGRFQEAFPMNPTAYFYHAKLHDVVGKYNPDEHYGMDLDFVIRAVQRATVLYQDQVWGNYRYLRGTKSYDDDLAGNNAHRVMAIVNRHLAYLPLSKRYSIYLRRMIGRNISRIRNLIMSIPVKRGR